MQNLMQRKSRIDYHGSRSKVAFTWFILGVALTAIFALSDWIVLGSVRPIFLTTMGLACAFIWVAVGPLVALASSAITRSIQNQWLLASIHSTNAIAFAVLCTTGFAALMWIGESVLSNTQQPFWEMFRSATFYFLLANAVFYGFVVIGHGFLEQQNEMDRMKVLESRMQQQLTSARMDVLRIQMQPHFLFNSLNSVASLVRVNETALALRSIEKLGDVLRTTLDQKDEPFAPLESELENIENYLEIEQLRFGDRLDVEFDIEKSTRNVKIPRWILQPMVENAIIHGVEKLNEKGTIQIETKLDDDRLLLFVRDNGDGVAERMEPGIGLGNSKERLTQIYGTKFSLEVIRNDNQTESRLVIPVRFDVFDE